MKAKVLPVLERIRDFYSQPRDFQRFEDYLRMLQGGHPGDLSLPISGFNPMAKDHILPKIQELLDIDAEGIMAECLLAAEPALKEAGDPALILVLNLVDDLLGGWTNRFSTEFQMTFEIQALVKRLFCTPACWSSESYAPDLIRQRTLQALHRTLYRLRHPGKLNTLSDHIAQETYVAHHLGLPCPLSKSDQAALRAYATTHAQSHDTTRIFNFFFGDTASRHLAYPTYGIEIDRAGFLLAMP